MGRGVRDIGSLRLGVNPLTSVIYLFKELEPGIMGEPRIDFEREVMTAITDRLLQEDEKQITYTFGKRKFKLTLEEIEDGGPKDNEDN